MSKTTVRINVRTTVSPSDFTLYERLSAPAGRSREALRLLRIGLKWEQFDATPQLLLPALSGIHSSEVSNAIQSNAAQSKCKSATIKREATVCKNIDEVPVFRSMMREWDLDPVAMFITGAPVLNV